MIVLGDYAAIHGLDSSGLQDSFGGEAVVLNLEGAIAEKKIESLKKKQVLFNVPDIVPFLKSLNVKAVTLANNHIFDIGVSIKFCREMLSEAGIDAVGAGENIEQACQPTIVHECEGVEYAIVPFCWNVTGGRYAAPGKSGVAPLTKDNVEQCIRKTKLLYPSAKVILIMHWGIELEKYPEPMHVQLAHYAIDCGADMIIGHHPHRIQPIEVYKGKYIFYSIGNFYIEEDVYFDGRLRYPECARESVAVRIMPDNTSIILLYRDNEKLIVKEEVSVEGAEQRFCFPVPFEDYGKWFKKNRVKKKAIPIFYEDYIVTNKFKTWFLFVRAFLIRILLFLGVKKSGSEGRR